jgi:hypothetical protein
LATIDRLGLDRSIGESHERFHLRAPGLTNATATIRLLPIQFHVALSALSIAKRHSRRDRDYRSG